MLYKIKTILAAVFFIGITLLLIGIGQEWFSWMAKLQFLPSCLALNFISIAIILVLVFVFGRIYCSVICPLGIFQDLIIKLRGKKKKFKYNPERGLIRVLITAFVIAFSIIFTQLLLSLIAPYSAYGRIVASFVAIISGSNSLTLPLILVGLITFIGIGLSAFLWGRAYCNTVCPVGTVLGLISRYSLFRPIIDKDKCVHCTQCEKKCKASCINSATQTIDCSRCVVCFECLHNCKVGAIKYKFVRHHKPSVIANESPSLRTNVKQSQIARNTGLPRTLRVLAMTNPSLRTNPSVIANECEAIPDCKENGIATNTSCSRNDNTINNERRKFLSTSAVALGAGVIASAQNLHLDGGLAEVVDKEKVKRSERIVPPGALSVKNFYNHCTACQLCVDNCPNKVLRPSTDLEHFLQPVMGYEKGYCRPECTVCSNLCPSGAILPIQRDEKLSIRIGKASVNTELCFAVNGKEGCGNCANHCPTGAIRMLNVEGKRTPVVNEEICIGCGACEYLCPVRPLSAITVNGLSTHIIK